MATIECRFPAACCDWNLAAMKCLTGKCSWTIPKGTRVSTVTLTSLSSPVITTGLRLITTTYQLDCEGCAELPPPPLMDTASWVPPLDPKYEWSVDVNADGSTTLFLKVYPFFYNAASTDVQFYPDFTFNIDTYAVPISIVELNTDGRRIRSTVSGTINYC